MAAEFTIKPTVQLLRDRNLGPNSRAQQFIDSEVLRRCDPYVPHLEGVLIKSGIIHTKIGSGKVVYATPYARKWYYTPAEFTEAPMRGNYWFEKMKQNGGKDAIARGVAKLTGGKIR